MDIGPVEYIVIGFPGNEFNGDILPALRTLVDSGTIRILDLLIVSKDEEGESIALELGEVVELEALFASLDYEIQGFFNEEDIELIAARLPDNSTAALMVWEDVWATEFATAVRNANGVIIDNVRVPHDIVVAAIESMVDSLEE